MVWRQLSDHEAIFVYNFVYKLSDMPRGDKEVVYISREDLRLMGRNGHRKLADLWESRGPYPFKGLGGTATVGEVKQLLDKYKQPKGNNG